MAANGYRLVIGNKNTSSWSLRPWLAMKEAAIPFEEVRINLRAPDMKDQILAHSKAGKVPVLETGDIAIWDSLAILEFLAEQYPDKALWPSQTEARALARSVSAEMHSGFQALREHCPMKLLAREPKDELIDPVQVNIRRIVEIWSECRKRFGGSGPFLFSHFTIADAMYAPVASRFRTYVPDLAPFGDDGTAAAYIDAIFALPGMAEWSEGARQETGA
ncbi:MAG: glutathione S-transferase family protein [Hyphomicrobium sp.]|jgi:glutathione S-transferase|uniref:glutathione S-transferase family protein n=1 Tax=Hyphomicrobium sp. TaxID=82 RepID=UPI0025BBB1FD|nr:glutathione S-transferase family protein [Hyphomicrobium sp.]MBX9864450.1 glutathione S-transferase family protein [Hyphomicrobium sp.]